MKIIRHGKFFKQERRCAYQPCPECGESRQFFDVYKENPGKFNNLGTSNWEGVDICGEYCEFTKGFFHKKTYKKYLMKCYSCGCSYETDPILVDE